jgi:hypothetical protein
MLRRILSLIWTIVLITQVCFLARAQTTPNPLQDEVDEAEARAKIAKAKKEELEARLPSPDADALKGSTDVEGELIESRIQAYKAMEEISKKIAGNADSKGIRGLYIYREADYAKIVSYKKLLQQLDIINGEYDQCLGRPAVAAVPLGVLANIFLNWLPLLKTETKITGSEFDIEDEAVWASLGDELSLIKPVSIPLGNPFISSFDFADLSGISTSVLFTKLKKAQADFDTANCTNAAYTLKPQVNAAFTKLKEDIGLQVTAPTPETKKTTTTTTVTPPTTTVDETLVARPATSPTQHPIAFFDYLKTEEILNLMNNNSIYWIKIKVIKSGGNMRVKSNPLIDIFRGGSSIKFSGGSIAYYYILDNQGAIKLSGNVYGYVPYTKSSQVDK